MNRRVHLAVELLALLEQLVDQRVDERLSARGILNGTEYCGSSLPPRTSRRAFLAACRGGKVAGATRDGRGWKCSAQAWAEFKSRMPVAPVRGAAARSAAASGHAANDDHADLDGLLGAAGMRPTRRST